MTNRLSVSVLIATYNAAEFISETLDSVLGQTNPATEIIVVDDGSSDATREIVGRYASQGVTLRCHERNLGVAAAVNTAYAAATSELVALLGHDDIWLPQKLERQLQAFALDAGIDVCFTDYVEFGIDPQPGTGFGQRGEAMRAYPRRQLADGIYKITSPSFLVDLVRIQATPMPSTMLFRSTALAKAMPLDEDIAVEDVQITFRLANRAAFACIDEPLMRRRMHRTNWGPTMGQLRWLDNHVKTLQRLPAHVPLSKEERAGVDALLADYLGAAGYAAFTKGDLSQARSFFGDLLARRFSGHALFYWSASCLPWGAVSAVRKAKQILAR